MSKMKRRSSFGLFALLVALALPASMLAAPFANGGFENDSANIGAYVQVNPGSTQITGWTVVSAVDWIGTYWPAPEGSKSIDMNASPSMGALSQTFDTTVNNYYFVAFKFAGNPTIASSCAVATKTMTVSVPGKTQAYSFDTTGKTYAAMGWVQEEFVFKAGVGTSTTLTFASTTEGNCGPAIDDVVITEVVATGTQCKNDGWKDMFDHMGNMFKNQGDCVSYYATDNFNLGAIPAP